MKLNFLNQSTEYRRNMILNGNTLKTLLFLSVPTLMLSLVQCLMPLSDSFFINNVAGTYVAGAVAFCQPVINLMVALSQGLGVATMAMIGQMNGRGDFKGARHLSTQIFVLGFCIGLCLAPILAILSIPLGNSVDATLTDNVTKYIALYAVVLPFQFLIAIFNAIKNATGKPESTFTPMAIMLVLKIIFSLIFIVWLRLEVFGCVLASFCATFLVACWMFYVLFVHKGDDQLTLKGFRFDFGILKELIRLGVPSMLNSVMLSLGFLLINFEVREYGAVALTGQSIANSISQICFNLPSAFGSAVTTMVSMNIGAGFSQKAKKSCTTATILSIVTAVIMIAIMVPLAPYITVFFTKDPQVMEMANKALSIYVYAVIGFGICMVQQGAFIGLGRTKIPLIAGILRIWLFRYLFILCTESFLGVYSVFWGNLFSNCMAAVVTTILILRTKWVSVIPQSKSFKKEETEQELSEESEPVPVSEKK